MQADEIKKKIYSIIFESDTKEGKLFDICLMAFIISSILTIILESMPSFRLSFGQVLRVLEWIYTIFFTLEYALRVYCSPKPKKYIFSFFGVVDFLATFPIYLILFAASARYFLVIRAFRLIRVFRVFKLFNFMNEGEVLLQSLMMSWKKIFVFFFFVVIMVTSIGTLMYMIEGQQPGTAFDSIPSSIYWAIVTMTTVGYGDITPVTALGRFLSAVVMLMGYTIIAVPTGIVSAAAFNAYRNSKGASRCEHCGHVEHDSSARYCKYCGDALGRKDKTTK